MPRLFRPSPSSRRHLAVAALLCALAPGLPAVAQAADKKPVNAAPAPASAQAPTLVSVDGAWIRPTVKGQTASGGFMDLTASRDLTLVGFSTPVAGVAELHEMAMDGAVMRMRAIESLSLPAGKAVALRPGHGGQHLMLMDLRRPLKEGEELLLTLKLRGADGKVLTQDVKVPVRSGAMPAQGGHKDMHKDMHKDAHHHHGE